MLHETLQFLRLFDEATCQAAQPDYHHRVDDPGTQVPSAFAAVPDAQGHCKIPPSCF